MTLVGVDTAKGELLRYELGSREPVVRVPIRLSELQKRKTRYLCAIWPAGDHTYAVQVTHDPDVEYDPGSPASQIFVVYPGTSKRLERWHVRNPRFLSNHVPVVMDQNPVAPEIILVAWRSPSFPHAHSYTLFQMWTMLPQLRMVDEWVIDHPIEKARFPEAWPVSREDIVYLEPGEEEPVISDVVVPLTALERLADPWMVTPYGRYLYWETKNMVMNYGHGTVPLWESSIPVWSWLGHLDLQLLSATGAPRENKTQPGYIGDNRTGLLAPSPVPAVFTGGDLSCVIIDTVDLDWTGQRLEPILTALLRSSDLAGYLLRAYQPSAVFPGMH